MTSRYTNSYVVRYLRYVIGYGFMNSFFGILVYGFRFLTIGWGFQL